MQLKMQEVQDRAIRKSEHQLSEGMHWLLNLSFLILGSFPRQKAAVFLIIDILVNLALIGYVSLNAWPGRLVNHKRLEAFRLDGLYI